MPIPFLAWTTLVLALVACAPTAVPGPTGASGPGMEVWELPPAQEAFWEALADHCGQAFTGEITRRPAADRLFRGDEVLAVHFRECDEHQLRLPFHVEENRSRTWVIRRVPWGLELRHDHRHADGAPEENTWYGAYTRGPGSGLRQEFLRPAGDGPDTGWRIEIEPGVRYTYGTIRDGEWTYRLDFDLSAPVNPPPAPWGYR